MKISIGLDILNFNRIKILWNIYQFNFLKKVLSKYEIKKIISKKFIISYFCKRFSIKEAFAKAIGSGFRNNIKLSDINLYKNNLGKPNLYFSGKTKNFLIKKNIKNFYISISDENKYIISIVIIEYY